MLVKNDEYLLEMRGIAKSFPGVRALKNASLKLKRGEVHALVGENGAGKSTLMNILLGSLQQDEGEIIFKGNKVNFKSPHEALSSGISMIHQEISLIPTVDISENIWIGREKRFEKYGLISRRRRNQATKGLLEQLNIRLDPQAIVRSLSVANMQLVELARAVSYNSDMIIMDEPTSSLTDHEIKLFYDIIRKLAAKGTAIIFISHKLDEVYKICDHITVMRDGEYICDHPIKEITQEELIAKIAGREIKDLFPKQPAQIRDVVLDVRNLCFGNSLRNVSFTVHKGEILGFFGLVGAGRTEIMQSIFGIDPCDDGEIYIEGKKVRIRSPRDAIKSGIGMVTEDRLHMGIIANLAVGKNISLTYLKELCNKLGFIDQKRESSDVQEISARLSIKAASMRQTIGSLSGGNQQKAILAKWLLAHPKVLIMDEPTRGIDVGSKSEIHRLISQLAQSGMGIILVSSETPEILGMSDRIFVVRNGALTAEFPRNEATQEKLVKQAFGI